MRSGEVYEHPNERLVVRGHRRVGVLGRHGPAGLPIGLQRAMAAVLSQVAHLRGYQGRNEEYLRRGPSEIVELDRSEGVPAIAGLGAAVRRVRPQAGD
jgi:hypothetical protein